MNTQEQAREEKAKLWDAADAGKLDEAADAQESAKVITPATTTDEAAAAKLTAATPKEVVVDDPYKDLPDSVRHEIIGLKSMLTKATERQRSTDGRLGGMQSELKQLKDGLAARTVVAPTAAPSTEEIRVAQGDAKAMAKLVEDYPEFGAAMKGAIDEELKGLKEQLKALTPAAPASAPAGLTREDVAQMTDAAKKTLQIEIHHPNWEARVATPQFRGWLEEQPDEVKALAASASPLDAISLLDKHSEAIAPAARPNVRTQRLASAAAIPSGRTPTARTKPTDQMTKAELWAHLDAIDESKGK